MGVEWVLWWSAAVVCCHVCCRAYESTHIYSHTVRLPFLLSLLFPPFALSLVSSSPLPCLPPLPPPRCLFIHCVHFIHFIQTSRGRTNLEEGEGVLVEGFIKNQIVDIVTGKWFMVYIIMVNVIYDNCILTKSSTSSQVKWFYMIYVIL